MLEVVDQYVQDVATTGAHLEIGRHGVGQVLGSVDRHQVHPTNAVLKGGRDQVRRFDGQARLSDATWTGQRYEPVFGDDGPDLGGVVPRIEKGRRRLRHRRPRPAASDLGELLAQAGVADLEYLYRCPDSFEEPFPVGDQPHILRQGPLHHLFGDTGDQYLAAVGGAFEPSGDVHGEAVHVTVDELRLPRVDAHPDADLDRSPVLGVDG